MIGWGDFNWYLRFLLLVSLVTADQCPVPDITNGQFVVDGVKQENFLFGEVVCDKAFLLIGSSSKIKCRQGIWSQRDIPRCSAIGSCPELAQLHNGKNIPVQNSRGSAFVFKCNRGFKRFGVRDTHCNGDNWSHRTNMPICTKNTCNKTGMLDVPYGQGKALMHGAVYKYRCNPGAEMEGEDTVACTGLEWNGSLPHCNVVPSQPSLELIVKGNVVSQVRERDWVLVTCQGRGGNPLPEIGLMLDGKTHATKDFREWSNSFTFIASASDNGKKIECTAANKVGSVSSVTELNVLSSPSGVKISGPGSIKHNSNFTYFCAVEGGNPRPSIRWKVEDVEMSGDEVEERMSRLDVVTGDRERKMTVSCLAENSLGVVSHSLHVDTEYLPQRIMINTPATVIEGEEAAVSCITSQSHPAPKVTWKLEKIGAKHEILEKVSGETTLVLGQEEGGDGGRLYRAGFVIEEGEELSHVQVSCRAVVEGLGEVDSDSMKIIVEKKPVEEVEYSSEYEDIMYNEVEDKNEAGITDLNTGELVAIDDEDSVEEVTEVAVEDEESTTMMMTTLKPSDIEDEYYYDEEEADAVIETDAAGSEEADNFVKLVPVSSEEEEEEIKEEEIKEKEKSKEILWIPIGEDKDITEYQDEFTQKYNMETDADEEEEFLQPANLPEPQPNKDQKSSMMINNPTPVMMTASAHATFNNNFVRFTLTILSTCISLRYFY